MGTSFEELYDVLMSASITDYRLDNLFLNNKDAFCAYLAGFVKKGILEVSSGFITSLSYSSVEENIGTDDKPVVSEVYYFDNELLPLEKLALVKFMASYWYQKKTDDSIEIDSRIGTKSERDTNTTSSLKLKLQRVTELKCEALADIRKLQNENLEAIGWGDW